MHLGLLLALWVAPLSLKEQRFFFVASEVLSAWSSLDVFTVSIIVREQTVVCVLVGWMTVDDTLFWHCVQAAIFEISQFAQFLVGDAYVGSHLRPGFCVVVAEGL